MSIKSIIKIVFKIFIKSECTYFFEKLVNFSSIINWRETKKQSGLIYLYFGIVWHYSLKICKETNYVFRH